MFGSGGRRPEQAQMLCMIAVIDGDSLEALTVRARAKDSKGRANRVMGAEIIFLLLIYLHLLLFKSR